MGDDEERVSAPSRSSFPGPLLASAPIMRATIWFLIIGALLVVMALGATVLRRLPLTTAILYLGVGAVLGPAALGFARVDPVESAALIERATEVVVLISLFGAGLKLRAPWRDPERSEEHTSDSSHA